MDRARRTACALVALIALTALAGGGCATTAYYERAKLSDRCMQLDSDDSLTYIRHKTEAAREGSVGGFGAAVAGGCGCQ
jgi:hypothetical protein